MSNFVDDGSNYDKRGFSMAATCSPTCLPVSPDYRILKSFRPRAFKRLVENSLRVSTSAAHGKIILLSPLPPPLFPRVITLNLNLSPAFVRENYGPFSPNANEPLPPTTLKGVVFQRTMFIYHGYTVMEIAFFLSPSPPPSFSSTRYHQRGKIVRFSRPMETG